jgi:hypothetical protein
LNFGEPYGPTAQKRQETKGSGRFFEKKLRKKLLSSRATGVFKRTVQINKSFFASFCSQKEVLSSLWASLGGRLRAAPKNPI